jgi:hypothetical protein
VKYSDMMLYTRETGESRNYALGTHALVGEILESLRVTLNVRWNSRLLDRHVTAVLEDEQSGWDQAREESFLSRQSSQRGFEGQQLSLFPS